MKKVLYYSLCLALGAASMSSCADNYLDVSPEDAASSATVFSTVDMLKGAVNGLSLIMCDAYDSGGFGRQGYNGEATVMLWYGTYGGHDAQYSNATSYKDVVNCTYMDNNTASANNYVWYYYYKLIANANAILLNIDNVSGDKDEIKFCKAQALTCRAYGYSQLVQFYCKRWSDSREGASRGLPLRLSDDTGSLECSSLKDVYARIYEDLDEAIDLFGSTRVTRDKALWQPDASVAHGVYVRAALAREDWNTVATHAKEARKGYSLMTAEDYGTGFNTPNKEWIWETYTDATENLGVYGFFAYCGSNTPSSKGYKYIGTIDKGLYEAIPEGDARKWIYMAPQEGESGWSEKDSGKTTKGNFYDRVKEEYADRIYKSTVIFPYMSTKFMTITDRSIGNVCIMRAAEMIYSEAEARYMLGGQEAQVRTLLEEAVAPYQDGYSAASLSGQALLDEVKLYRRFDLWGEGRGWFDQKRWKTGNVRKGWKEGGNWHPDFCGTGSTGGTYGPEAKNGWTAVIPNRETDYNKLINNPVEPDNWTPGM